MKPVPRPSALWITLALVALIAHPTASAEEEAATGIDLKGHLDPIARTLDGWQEAPAEGGHDGRITDAWKEFVKRRASRMQRRIKDLRSLRLWNYDVETKRVLGLEPKSWTPFIKDAASLHTELGECEEGYRKKRVTPDHALRLWKRRNPGPDPIGRVPGQDALYEVERIIRDIQAQGLLVSVHLWNSRNRLRRTVQDEQRRAREQNLREYEERRQVAAAAIARSVDETRGHLTGIANDLAECRRLVRALVSTAQQTEEERLHSLADETSEDPIFRGEVVKLLAAMAQGRRRTVNFNEARHSKYRGDIQQRWMLPRGKLRKLIEKNRAE